jgi:Fic-DOC domain mobile mystery protein B
MGLNLEYGDGQTPLSEEEKEGLLIPTITTHGELDEFEQNGVENAVEWTRRRTVAATDILTEDFILELHRHMFKDIWQWAGTFRTTNKNLGVDKNEIRTEIRKLLDDCRYWIEHHTFDHDEIAVRFSHRIVTIHPFVNGNGRHSRLIADILVSHGLGRPHFTWGSISLSAKGAARAAYLQALRQADANNFSDLIQFTRG